MFGGVRTCIWWLFFKHFDHHPAMQGRLEMVKVIYLYSSDLTDTAVWYKQCKSRRCWEVKLSPREVSKDTLTTP